MTSGCPDSDWLLSAKQRPLWAGEQAPLGIALHIQPLIWPGQGKVLCQQARWGRFYCLVLTLMLLTLLHSQRRQLSANDWHQLTQQMQHMHTYLSRMLLIIILVGWYLQEKKKLWRLFSKSAKKRRARGSLHLNNAWRIYQHHNTFGKHAGSICFPNFQMVSPQNRAMNLLQVQSPRSNLKIKCLAQIYW